MHSTSRITFATLFVFLCSCVIVHAPPPSSQPRPAAHRPRPKPARPKPASASPAKKPTARPARPAPSGAGKPARPKPQPKPPAPRPAPRPQPKPGAPSGTQMVVPVRVDFAEAVERVDSRIQKTITQNWQTVSAPNSSTKVEVRYTVWRDPIKAVFADGKLDVTVNVRYAADVRASIKNPLGGGRIWITRGETWGTKAEPQRIAARFHARFKIEDDFRVTAEAGLDDIDHGPAPTGQACVKAVAKVCISKQSIAPMVRKNLEKALVPQIEQALDQADQQLEQQLDLKAQAQTLWAALQQPQSLQQLGQGRCPTEVGAVCTTPAWLVAKPTSVGVSQPRMDGKDLRVDLALAGQLAVLLGDRPAVKPTPLPRLQPVTDPPGFAVRSRLRLPLGQLNAELGRRLKGEKLGGRGAPEIVVTYVKILDEFEPRHPHRLRVAVGVGGAITAELKLQGELAWNSRTHELAVQNFDYTVTTDNQALQKLSASHHAALRKLVAAKARWKLDTKAAALSEAVTQALGGVLRGRLEVHGALRDLDVEEFAVKDEALDAEVVLRGELGIAYTP